jgi:poly(A) polymerase
MRILNIPAGPAVGEAYRFLLELRLDRGPLDSAVAEAELRDWWSTRS